MPVSFLAALEHDVQCLWFRQNGVDFMQMLIYMLSSLVGNRHAEDISRDAHEEDSQSASREPWPVMLSCCGALHDIKAETR